MKHSNLIYFILTFNENYVPLFSMLLQSLLKYSSVNFDILIITNNTLLPKIKALRPLSRFQHDFHIVPEVETLDKALQYKATVFDYPKLYSYDKIMYMDVDIIVQNDVACVFDELKPEDGILYGSKEQNGTHCHGYWSLMKYRHADIVKFMKNDILPFNVGVLMFKPTKKMQDMFSDVHKMMRTHRGKHFFEQSFFNHYFNKKLASDVSFLSSKITIFPIDKTYYPHPTFMHFAGIGQYENKKKLMKAYLQILVRMNHRKLLDDLDHKSV